MTEQTSTENFIVTPDMAFWIGWFAKQAALMQIRYDDDSRAHRFDEERSYQLIFWLTSHLRDGKNIYLIIVRVGSVPNVITNYRVLCECDTQVAAEFAYSKLQHFYADMQDAIKKWSTYNSGP